MRREKQRKTERERVYIYHIISIRLVMHTATHRQSKTRHSAATIASSMVPYITVLSMNGSKYFEPFRTQVQHFHGFVLPQRPTELCIGRTDPPLGHRMLRVAIRQAIHKGRLRQERNPLRVLGAVQLHGCLQGIKALIQQSKWIKMEGAERTRVTHCDQM